MSGKQNTCYCLTCKKYIKSLGIARHRAMHRDRKENCQIEFSNGAVARWHYGDTNKVEEAKERVDD